MLYIMYTGTKQMFFKFFPFSHFSNAQSDSFRGGGSHMAQYIDIA
jgi:hypothetical protein